MKSGSRFLMKHSLLSQYVLLLLTALVLLPAVLILLSLATTWISRGGASVPPPYREGAVRLEQMWHAEAAALAGASAQQVDGALRRLKEHYPEAGMFWVDGSGRTRLVLPEQVPPDIPPVWTPSYTVSFMKERTGNSGVFTIVAFIGGAEEGGFMVFELPVRWLQGEINRSVWYMAGLAVVSAAFLTVSLLFFLRIRRRLVRLQEAMGQPAANGIPAPVPVWNGDEIGRLEGAFNGMVRQLQEAREREEGEERLRRELIAKLSHDLRTPLTAIRGHAYSLKREPLSDRGASSVDLIERKTDYLGQLLDNLLSYSLLSAGKYPCRMQRTDVVRLVRIHMAGWYPAFEQAGFRIELELPEEAPVYWEADPQWLERILDNYLQNVLRHAKSGGYVAVRVRMEHGGSVEIGDRGPGMEQPSEERGAGIGLSIAALMLKEMGLRAEIESGATGTVVWIGRVEASAGFLNEN